MNRSERLYECAADRAANRPEYLGWVLRRYMEVEGLDWNALVGELGGSAEFAPLALCLRPQPGRFAADVREVAEKFGLEPAALARVVRMVDTLEAIRGSVDLGADRAGTVLAARSRPPEKKDDEEPKH